MWGPQTVEELRALKAAVLVAIGVVATLAYVGTLWKRWGRR